MIGAIVFIKFIKFPKELAKKIEVVSVMNACTCSPEEFYEGHSVNTNHLLQYAYQPQ